MSTTSVSPLRQRMIKDMRPRNLAPRTQETYIRGCKKLAAFLRRSPDARPTRRRERTSRLFQLHLAEQAWAPAPSVWAKGGEVIVQITGMGPTATKMIPQK